MNTHFLDFWHLYAPLKEFSNRYLACKRLWESMDEASCEGILKELEHQRQAESVPQVHETNEPVIRKGRSPVAVKSSHGHDPVMLSSLAARSKHRTITGPCTENQTAKPQSPYGKSIFFDPGIDSVQGILIGTDPLYIRRYP